MDITVLVDDMNDNAPTFSGPLEFAVSEQCSPGENMALRVCVCVCVFTMCANNYPKLFKEIL